MHFLCSTFGSSGDVFPMLGLALELKRRGHEVTVGTNEHFAPLIRKYNLPFESLGTEADYQACIRHPDLWHPRRAFAHVFNSLRPVLRQQYQWHVAAAARGPVMGVTNCFGFGAFLARDKLGIPVVTLHLQPSVIWSDFAPPTLPGLNGPRWLKGLAFRIGERFFLDPVVCPMINAWRSELGLAPIRRVVRWWNSPDGVVCLFPDWFAPPQADWPSGIRLTDFPLWNERNDATLPDDARRFLDEGDRPLVFTPGSANLHGAKFFSAALQTCQALGRRAIFLTSFAEQVPATLPNSVRHFAYLPLDQLLPHSTAFVHHGGVGSMSQGMLAGVPQVLMPLAHDQFDNAARVRQLGLGDSLPAPQFTARRLTPMLERLLASSNVPVDCRTTAERLAKRDGLSRAADAMEAIAKSRNL